MKVILAEKPSVAREIAAIVGANNSKDGYLIGNDYAVSWAFGHLVGLALPEQYGFVGFQRENLPILPETFQLMPRQIKDGKNYKPDPGVMKQLKVIKELFSKCERIIVATDAGREGELIFRFIYQYLGCSKPFDRLWISSLTEQAIRKGLDDLHAGKEYDKLYQSAKARSEADWLIGINASQALSISAGRGVWSLGRVQTPTLAMICSRYLENKNFKPQTYFQIKVSTAKDATRFSVISTERYHSFQEAEDIVKRVRSMDSMKILNVEKKEVNHEPPLLYDLTTLQKEANSRFNFTAEQTLSIAQSLYEAKHISYPRTGSRYISEDVFAEIPLLIHQLSKHAIFGNYAKSLSGASLNKHAVNDKKVTDHHALIITENIPDKTNLTESQRIVYDMIVVRMLEAFSGKCTKENTNVQLKASEISFAVKGSITLIPGWRAVLNSPDNEKDDDDFAVLPQIDISDILPINGVDLLEKQTKARPLHTESSLLSAMETCGKELADEAEREAIKESGIGTPATRANIIETLFSREYIFREKKSLVPTQKGLIVYHAVKEKKIANVAMTGEWESALNKIASGEMNAEEFHRKIEVYATQVTTELLENQLPASQQREAYPCPKCKNGEVVIFQKVAKCTNEDCNLIVFRNKSGKELTNNQIKELLTKGVTGLIKGFKSKEQKLFDAHLVFDDDFKISFSFPQNTNKRKK